MNRLPFLSILLGALALGQEIPFAVGEELEYTAQFEFIPAGKAFLRVLTVDTVNGYPTFHVQFLAKTGAVADRLYKIRDRVDIWIDQKGLFTHKQVKRIREGNYRKELEMVINYRDSTAIVNNDTNTVDHPLRDPYSLFYYLRTTPLKAGQSFHYTTFENNKTTEFQLKVTGKEIVNTPASTFPSLVVRPFRRGKALFKNQGDVQIWFSDDKLRLPVQIQIKLKYGSLLLRLKKVTL